MPLTDIKIRNAKPTDKPQKLFDGDGLFLLVVPSGGKWWRFKYRFGGKEKQLSLGTYPEISLIVARRRREDARERVALGIDPGEARKAEKQAAIAETETFEMVAREWLTKFSPTWDTAHAKRKLQRLERDAFPLLGSRPIKNITPPELLTVLRRIEKRGALATAHTIRSIAGQIFRYAVATGRVERDLSADLKGALPPAKVKHRPAITEPAGLAPLLRAIDDYDGQAVVKCALRLLPLVFTRPGELRMAEWAEFDLEAGEWNIPAGRMKMRNPHLVPLSTQATAILRELQSITGGGKLLFPSIRTTAKPISDNTLNAALRRMGYSTEEVTAHGFRATARTILEEVLLVPTEHIEQQLAHTVKDPLGRAYNRTKHLDARRKMMQTWADYLDDIKTVGKVIPLKRPTAP